jgi:hypothetical protein
VKKRASRATAIAPQEEVPMQVYDESIAGGERAEAVTHG